jgi:predicted O-linked N-acetylglucosamine transferase (SPINDLY family)
MLRALGLSDLAADSSEAYVRIAADLAHDRDRLASLRTGLRSHMASSSLCDAKSFTLALEQAYRTMISRLVADGS